MRLTETISNIIWGTGTIILIILCGLIFTIKFKFLQFRSFNKMMLLPFNETKNNIGISSFAAMATALGGTMGVGNIVGVGSAIAIGGPGAVFWMWISAFFGMATKYAENYYAVKYRKTDNSRKNIGGPMAYMEYGLGARRLGKFFCILTAISSFGIGNAIQIGALNESLNNILPVSPTLLCIILVPAVLTVLLGGAERISKISSYLIPIISLLYIAFCLIIIFIKFERLPEAFYLILAYAFKPLPMIGGFIGSNLLTALKTGVNHGVFSNEAGMGSSSIAHACGNGNDADTEGIWGMFEVFFDTVICCTLTALAVIVTDSWIIFEDSGDITSNAFASVFGTFGNIFIAVCITLFAFATLISWFFYGEKSLEYLNIKKFKQIYLYLYIAVAGISCFFKFSAIMPVCDILNGLAVIPNVISLLILSAIDKRSKVNYNMNKKNRRKLSQ